MKRAGRGARTAIIAAVVVMGGLALAAFAVPGVAQVISSGLFPASNSCAVTVHTENGQDDAIQDAINAYPGHTICVGPGTFPEQVTISSSNTVLKGDGSSTIIEPNSPLVMNTYDYDNGEGPTAVPAAAIILVEGSSGDPTTGVSGVTVEDLVVNGINGESTFTNCGQQYFGVDFQASSGTLTSTSVTNIELPSDLFSCQDGLGIYAYNGHFNYPGTNVEPDSVTISHTTVTNYDKNGITCDDPAEACTVSSDTVTGIGPTGAIGQNGVQIAYGALGTVEHSTVSGNNYTNGTGTSTNDWYAWGYAATGVLLYDSATGTSVSSNTVSLNQIGIAYADDGSLDGGFASTTISHNILDTSTAYAIVADGAPGGGDQVTIASNTINNEESENSGSGVWGAPGILVDTGSFTVTGNSILGSSTSAGSSNGASQIVCGPDSPTVSPGGSGTTGTPVLYCASYGNLGTAAIQGASESGSNQTNMTLSGNEFTSDSSDLETLGVLGGSVNVDWV